MKIASVFFRMSVAIAVIVFTTSLLAGPSAAASYRFVTLEYPPYEYSEGGEIKGIAVDVIKETFKLLGHDIDIEIYPWARSIAMLQNGEADGISTFFKNSEREAFTYYSKEVVLLQKMALWTRKDAAIDFSGDLAELADLRIGTVRKTSYGMVFDQAATDGTIKVLESYTIGECITQLLNKRIDIWVSNYYGALYQLKKADALEQVKRLEPFIEEIPTYIGFSRKKGLENLRDDFDRAFAELKKTGVYAEILRRYQQ